MPGATTADFWRTCVPLYGAPCSPPAGTTSPWAGRPSPAAEFPLISRRGDRRPTRAAKGVYVCIR